LSAVGDFASAFMGSGSAVNDLFAGASDEAKASPLGQLFTGYIGPMAKSIGDAFGSTSAAATPPEAIGRVANLNNPVAPSGFLGMAKRSLFGNPGALTTRFGAG
jgi:hypothetical protein